MTPRLSILIGEMTHVPWIWSSQNSVGCSITGTFICSSVLPSLQHVFPQCLMCSWCGIQLWTKLATPPLWQSSLAFSRVKMHNSDKDKVKEMFQSGHLFGEAEIRQRGWEWGWGRVVILFSIGRLLALVPARPTEAGRGAPWCQCPTFAHSIQLRSPTLGVDRFSVFPPSHAVDAKKRDTVSVLFT